MLKVNENIKIFKLLYWKCAEIHLPALKEKCFYSLDLIYIVGVVVDGIANKLIHHVVDSSGIDTAYLTISIHPLSIIHNQAEKSIRKISEKEKEKAVVRIFGWYRKVDEYDR